MSMMKYRVHEVAKDFNTTSKVITQILTDYATTPKNHMQVLENDELNIIFEYMTQQIRFRALKRFSMLSPRAPSPNLRKRKQKSLPQMPESRQHPLQSSSPHPKRRRTTSLMFLVRSRRSESLILAAARR